MELGPDIDAAHSAAPHQKIEEGQEVPPLQWLAVKTGKGVPRPSEGDLVV